MTGEAKSGGHKTQKSDQRFVSDAEISSSMVFRSLAWIPAFARWFHAFELSPADRAKLEQLKDESVLAISYHSKHNWDVPLCTHFVLTTSGKAMRGLFHRDVINTFPFSSLQYAGMVAGLPTTAKQLLEEKYWVAVLPGGIREAMTGSEHAYELIWETPRPHDGFAKVALAAGPDKCKVIPMMLKNTEESRFSPITFLLNITRLSRLYWYLIKLPGIGPIIDAIGTLLFAFNMFFTIPLPVKLTAVICDPVPFSSTDSPSELRKRVQMVFQKQMLINQGGTGLNYTRALQERIDSPGAEGIPVWLDAIPKFLARILLFIIRVFPFELIHLVQPKKTTPVLSKM